MQKNWGGTSLNKRPKKFLVKVYLSYAHYYYFSLTLKFLLRVVRDVDKDEISLADTFIIVQSYAEELGTDILEQG